VDAILSFLTQKPGTVTYQAYEGGPSLAFFEYGGTASESTAVTVVPGQYTELHAASTQSVRYSQTTPHRVRLTIFGDVELSVTLAIPSDAVLQNTDWTQCCLQISDMIHPVFAGIDGSRNLGLFRLTGTFLGNTIQLEADRFYEVTLKKFAYDRVELWVDGKLISRQGVDALSPGGLQWVSFGIQNFVSPGMKVRVKRAAVHMHNPEDLWNLRVPAQLHDPDTVEAWEAFFQTGDVGKQIVSERSGAVNSYGGNNNGSFQIKALIGGSPTTQVQLQGFQKTGAVVTLSQPTRISVPENVDAFMYPDDLGKQIVISGSTLGNNGTYTISQLFDPDTDEDLALFMGRRKRSTNQCAVAAASFVSEQDLTYSIEPTFEEAFGGAIEFAEAGSLTDNVITLRKTMGAGIANRAMRVDVSNVLSAQLMPDHNRWNTLLSEEVPLLYRVYPFYLADPLGVVRAYLDILTVAGVIPEIELMTT
jgi:hypothetical protein